MKLRGDAAENQNFSKLLCQREDLGQSLAPRSSPSSHRGKSWLCNSVLRTEKQMGHSNAGVEVEGTPSARTPQGQEHRSIREMHSCSVRVAMPPVLTMAPVLICWCCAMLINQYRLERGCGNEEQRMMVVGTGPPRRRTEQDGVRSS